MFNDSLLEKFVNRFQEQHNERLARLFPDSEPMKVRTEKGYKFVKVFLVNAEELRDEGRYMVDRRTGDIYGVKSWTQVNFRRWFGTLETVEEYDWSEYHARPLPGTDAEREHVSREDKIRSSHKKRGRKTRAEKLATVVKPKKKKAAKVVSA